MPAGQSVKAFNPDHRKSTSSPRRFVALALDEEVPGLKPVMWGPTIIGFGAHSPSLKNGYEREGGMPAAAFSPRNAHLLFYLGHEFRGAEDLYAQLGKHKKQSRATQTPRP